MPDGDRRPNAVDVLLQEYALLKSELNLKNQDYERQITYSQFLVAIFAGILVYLFNGGEAALANAFGWPHKLVFAFAAFTIAAFTFLLVFKVLESDFRMQVVATRMGMIEEMVNERIGDPVMHWESFLSEKTIKIAGALQDWNPSVFLAVLYFIILFGGAVFIPFTLYWHAWYDAGDGGPALGWLILVGVILTLAASVAALITGLKIHGGLRARLRAKMDAVMAVYAAGGKGRP